MSTRSGLSVLSVRYIPSVLTAIGHDTGLERSPKTSKAVPPSVVVPALSMPWLRIGESDPRRTSFALGGLVNVSGSLCGGLVVALDEDRDVLDIVSGND